MRKRLKGQVQSIMSHSLANKVRISYSSGNPAKKMVLGTLAAYADHDGTSAFPSVVTIAADTDLGIRTVQTKLAELRDDGVIYPSTSDKYKLLPEGRRPTCYTIVQEKLVGRDARKDELERQRALDRDAYLNEPTVFNGIDPQELGEGGTPDTGAGAAGGGVQEMHPTQSSYSTSPCDGDDDVVGLVSTEGAEPHSGGADQSPPPSRTDDVVVPLHGESSREGSEGPGYSSHSRGPVYTGGNSIRRGRGSLYDPASRPTVEADHPVTDTGQVDPRPPLPWTPPWGWWEAAKADCPNVKLYSATLKYITYYRDKGRQPSPSSWMDWVMRDQQSYERDVLQAVTAPVEAPEGDVVTNDEIKRRKWYETA